MRGPPKLAPPTRASGLMFRRVFGGASVPAVAVAVLREADPAAAAKPAADLTRAAAGVQQKLASGHCCSLQHL